MYVPFAQHFESWVYLVARTSGDPAAAATSLQVALRKAAPELAAQSAGPADTFLAEGYLLARVAGSAAGALGGLAMLLAMVGLYGVQSQIVAHRTREVGVRVALGATARHIQRLVMTEGFAPVLQGVALGLALGIVARLVFRVLLGVPLDPTESIALVLAPIPLGIAAFVACRIPAARASRVDPLTGAVRRSNSVPFLVR